MAPKKTLNQDPKRPSQSRPETRKDQEPRKDKGDLFYGLNTCMALFKHRTDGILRVYVCEDRLKKAARLLKWCADSKRPYHVVSQSDLEKITKSVHHEGLAILIKPAEAPSEVDIWTWLKGPDSRKSASIPKPLIFIYLDGLKNPHNLGSVIRTAAHFGVPLILGREGELPRLSPSAARIAEGGSLFVRLLPLADPEAFLTKLDKDEDFELIGTESALSQDSNAPQANSLYGKSKKLPPRMVLILGNEVTGMSQAIKSLVHRTFFIPGTSVVESLNVAVAAGIFLGEYHRLYGQNTVAKVL